MKIKQIENYDNRHKTSEQCILEPGDKYGYLIKFSTSDNASQLRRSSRQSKPPD